jgi:predicted hydrocarbon binding protein
MTLNSIIHPEVRKVYPGADVPVFELEAMVDERTMLMGYRSARQLCTLAEGFIEGSAAEFNEVASIEQPSCMHRGDERCLLKIVFTPKAA